MRHVKSSGSVKAIYLDRESVFRCLKELTLKLKKELPYVKEVRLFGSLVKGENHGLSDVDLLVIVDEINRENFWKIYGKVFDMVVDNLSIDFDLVVMSEKDFLSDPKRFGHTLKIDPLS